MVRGSVALLLGVTVVLVGPGASGQESTTSSSSTTTTEPPPGWTINVSPDTVDEPLEVVTLSGPGFPGQSGCRFGELFALGEGETVGSAKRLLDAFNFDPPWETTVTKWSDGTNFTEGVFNLVLACRDDGSVPTGTFPTGATLTVLASGVPPPDPTTTLPPTTTTLPDTVGTVEPTSARAGETTVTLRGNGFKPSTKLDITLKSSTRTTALGTVNALASGSYAATILIPATAPAGQQKVLVTGLGPDDVVRSTSADLLVIAASGGTATRTRTAASTSGSTAGALPATGPKDRTPYFVMAGLTAMTLGAFLVGMSHPAEPARGHHRRRRGGHLR
jgi:hypothetical protein